MKSASPDPRLTCFFAFANLGVQVLPAGRSGVRLLGIAASVVMLGELVTLSLALGTALVIAGIAIVPLDRKP